MTLPTYNLKLQTTYYEKGFFNLGVEVEKCVRPDNGPITLLLGEDRRKISGSVNRNANQNGTPRIFGKSELSDWFKQNFHVKEIIEVVILGPKQLWLRKPGGDDYRLLTSEPNQAKITPPSKINGSHNFQRVGAVSNTQAGNDFEIQAQRYLALKGITLTRNHAVLIGAGSNKKAHRFDLGSDTPKIIVECKSHTWTTGDNAPSAKVTVWNEVMFYFMLAPGDYHKILFVLKDYSKKRKVTLATYYIRNYGHLIPPGVEIWEYDPDTGEVNIVGK